MGSHLRPHLNGKVDTRISGPMMQTDTNSVVDFNISKLSGFTITAGDVTVILSRYLVFGESSRDNFRCWRKIKSSNSGIYTIKTTFFLTGKR